MQLIELKKIDGIIDYFTKHLNQFDTNFKLYIIGDGELKENLQSKVKSFAILISAITSALYMMLAFVQIYKLQFWFLSTIVTIIGVLLLFIIAMRIEHYRCGEKLWMLLCDYGMDIYIIGCYVQQTIFIVCGKILGFNYLVYAFMMLIFGIVVPIILSKYIVRKNRMLSMLILGR